LLVLLLAVGLAGIITTVAFPNVVGQYVPGLSSATPQPTLAPQVVVPKGTFTITNVEVLVPSGTTVADAYREAFLQLARQDPQYGANAQINPNAPPAFIGQPEKVRDEPGGTVYRATMQGVVFAPE
jgi:hypothetical protein